MALLLYNLFLGAYHLTIRLMAPFHKKAGQWVRGRKDLPATIRNNLQPGEKRIWVHCASLGEFEQARPIMEALREARPDHRIVLTFFSPSGYEVRKNYSGADYIYYLPLDGKQRSADFISLIDPAFVLMIKYEFWYYYLAYLKKRSIPVYLISATFREEQPFFKWYGGLFRKMLRCYQTIFVQQQQDKSLLAGIGIFSVTIAGDPRFDRVAAVAKEAARFPLVESFKDGSPVLIAGSTWPKDEALLKDSLHVLPKEWKVILAPHEIDPAHLSHIRLLFAPECIFYSEYQGGPVQERILVIDNIGMLSALYRYGDIAYIGGGFQKGGIHNSLEPAIFGLPVLFGPVYEKFTEARDLASQGFAFPVSNVAECRNILSWLISSDSHSLLALKTELLEYMHRQEGAARHILNVILSRQ